MRHPVLTGAAEWRRVSASLRHVLKIADTKFFACPVSTITRRSWDMLALVNQTTSAEGNILHLPLPGSYLQQPAWYREAVQIVRSERARHQREELDKEKAKRGHR